MPLAGTPREGFWAAGGARLGCVASDLAPYRYVAILDSYRKYRRTDLVDVVVQIQIVEAPHGRLGHGRRRRRRRAREPAPLLLRLRFRFRSVVELPSKIWFVARRVANLDLCTNQPVLSRR